MDETLDDLDELKDFFSAPIDGLDNVYPSSAAAFKTTQNSSSLVPPKFSGDSSVGVSRSRRFRGEGGSLFDEDDPQSLLSDSIEEHSSANAVSDLAWSELSAENRRLKQQLQFLTNELSVKEKRISQLERELAMLTSEPDEAPVRSTSMASSFSSSSPQRVLSLDTQGVFGGSNLLESFAGSKARDELTNQREPLMSKSIDRLTECGLINSEKHGMFARDVTYEVATEVRGEKGAQQMMESVEVGEFDRSDPHAEVMTYQEFLHQLMQEECSDIVDILRRFLGSVLGPNGDGSTPGRGEKLDYQFIGVQDIQHRCPDFLNSMETYMGNHAVWKNLSDAHKAAVRDHLEKYVMTKLYDLAFGAMEDSEMDNLLLKRMKLLKFVTPEALDIKPGVGNDMVWALAQDELRSINKHRSPQDKVACIVRACAVIFRSLNLARAKDPDTRPGADDFLPIFIYTVLTSNVPKLYSNCEYIHTFRNPNDLMSKSGYCLVNLRSAIEFVLNMDASVVLMDKEEFETKLQAATAEYDASS